MAEPIQGQEGPATSLQPGTIPSCLLGAEVVAMLFVGRAFLTPSYGDAGLGALQGIVVMAACSLVSLFAFFSAARSVQIKTLSRNRRVVLGLVTLAHALLSPPVMLLVARLSFRT